MWKLIEHDLKIFTKWLFLLNKFSIISISIHIFIPRVKNVKGWAITSKIVIISELIFSSKNASSFISVSKSKTKEKTAGMQAKVTMIILTVKL